MEAIRLKTLNKQSAGLFAMLNQDDRKTFTLTDAYGLLPSTKPPAVRKMLSEMVKRGLIFRIKEGVFYLIPYESNVESYMPDWHLIASQLTGNANYYVGYYSAMQMHGLITQPAIKEQIVVDRQIKPSTAEVKGVVFQFIYHNEKHFFGNKLVWADSFNKVPCSDLEKTFVDVLYKPDYAGGITEIAKALYKSKDQIDFEKLLAYAVRFNALSVFKRLGYLLETMEINAPILEKLRNKEAKSYYLLEPSRPKDGKMLSRWHIQENVDRASLLLPIFS